MTTNPETAGTISSLAGISYTYTAGWKTVYELRKKTVYLIWDSTGTDGYITSNLSNDTWRKITSHELGHALGYEGHITYEGLMASGIDKAETIYPDDKMLNHLMQVY